MVLEIIIAESMVRNVLIVAMWALTIVAVYVLYKINPPQTIFGLIVLCIILAIVFIQGFWSAYIAPLYSITMVP